MVDCHHAELSSSRALLAKNRKSNFKTNFRVLFSFCLNRPLPNKSLKQKQFSLPLATAANPILSPPDAHRERLAVPVVAQSKHSRPRTRRNFKSLLKLENASKAIADLPGAGESLHIICNGNFASWDLVPAILKVAGQVAVGLDIATLGFNRANAAEMRGLIDAGQVRELHLIYSHYFLKTSAAEHEYLIEQLAGRPAKYAAIRSHAKILAIELSDGRCLTVETSANLRSCRNIEQYAITNDRPLLEFHRRWIRDAIQEAERNGQAK